MFGIAMGLVDTLASLPSIDFPGRTVLAVVLAAAGVGAVLAGALQFRSAATTLDPTRPDKAAVLVTTGVFACSRNPIYLGFALILTGWALHLSNVFGFALLPVFVLYMSRFQIIPEENAMHTTFGDRYAAYRASVRRWI